MATDAQHMAQHTRFILKSAHIFMVLMALLPAALSAQVPTGTITGRITDAQDRSIGAVEVAVTSPALQGFQSTRTSANGDYILPLLPPGPYTIVVTGPGFAPQTLTRNVAARETVSLDVTLQAAGVTEDVTVRGETGTFVNTVEAATNFNQQLMNVLPTGRTMLSAVILAPAVHETGPSGNVSIAGAMSFENLFMVNGVQVQDNLRGDPFDLFIEDAIQETTISTSGISAEYGRFSGGVINTITKSGGNMFSGSFRTSFRNDDWRTISPFEETKIDKVVPTYEYTFGGPVVRDKTWFFAAGRFEDAQTSRQTAFTNIPYVFKQDEKRFEFKGTQALRTGHRLQVGYLGIQRAQINAAQPSSSSVMDLASLTSPETPESLLSVNYTGSLTDQFFIEAQFSQRNFTFKNFGGSSLDRIQGTPLSDNSTGAFWFSPLYCAVCGDEERDNDALLLKANYFLSTGNRGSHNISFGYDGFSDKTKVDNHQSGSDYHVYTTASIIEGENIYPVMAPGFSAYVVAWPIAESSQGARYRTHSLFANDTWNYNSNWTLNLGLRYDKNSGRDASKSLTANDSALSPRLGFVYDPTGTGRTTFNASYGRYVAAVASTIAGSGSPAGSPAILAYFYDGPEINTGDGPYVPSALALQQVFDWFDAAQPGPFQASIPGLAQRINGSLKSPHSDEFVVGVSHQITNNGTVRLDYVNRAFGDFYGERIDTTTGQVEDEFGQVFDLGLIENTNETTRNYRALNAQASYRVGTDFNAGASYTLSKLEGNINGENIGSGPIPTGVLRYPEYRDLSWANPDGPLAADQRHRGRIWATYSLPWFRDTLNMSAGLVQVFESGSPYAAVAAVAVDPYVENPGYAVTPGTMAYYFSARDGFYTETLAKTDLSFNLSRRLGGARAPEVFASFHLFNAFNQFQLFNISTGAINTTVLTNTDDESLAPFNPFTETPIEGVHWRKGEDFGQALARGAYTGPRTFRFSVVLRF